MSSYLHIPVVESIEDFFKLMRFGKWTGDDISVTTIQDQPDNKRTEVPLFRNHIYRIVYLEGAQVEWNLTHSRFNASDHCIYFAYPGKLESWRAHPDNRGYVLCFTHEFASSFSKKDISQALPFFNPEGRSILYLSADEASETAFNLGEMIREAESIASDRKIMLRFQLFQFFVKLMRVYERHEAEIPQEVRNHTRIFNQFKKFIDQYFADLAVGRQTTQLSVSIVADHLALTPGYLGTVITELTGKSAVSHINEKTVLEAKSYLLHTELQTAEIARRLGFNNASYFTRFFKKNTNMTPSTYQKGESG